MLKVIKEIIIGEVSRFNNIYAPAPNKATTLNITSLLLLFVLDYNYYFTQDIIN